MFVRNTNELISCLVVGSVLFVPLVSWYQNAAENPYGVMVNHFFVRCIVQAVRGVPQARVMELYDPVSDTIYNNLSVEWWRQWGQHSQLPEGGIELNQEHIDMYEHGPMEALEDDSGSESEGDGGLRQIFDQEQEQEQEQRLPQVEDGVLPQLLQLGENFVQDEDRAIDAVQFEQMLTGRRGWLTNLVGLRPDEIVAMLIRDMFVHVVECFNVKVAQEHTNVSRLTLGELMTWHALRMFMCLQKFAATDVYWKKGNSGAINYPDFGRFMTFSRFQDIRDGLRFEDYAVQHDRTDPAWKIRSITNIMKQAFQALLPCPRQYIAVDEGMVKYTGRKCPIKRVMPNKPITCGLKFFAAVDCSTGIMFDFDWDDGVMTAANCGHHPWGFTGEVVLKLIRPLPGQGYVVVTDNYYTSLPLARELLHRGHRLLGTIRSNRGVPEAVKLPSKKPTRACPKGTVRSCRTRDNRIYIFSWMDNGPVYLLDTVYGNTPAVLSRRDGRNVREFEVPKGFESYNMHMGGVDRYDQIRTGFYGVEMHGRCAKWTLRAYESLFNMALANAFAVFRYFAGEVGNFANHHQFMLDVANRLLHNVYVQAPRTRLQAAEQPPRNRHTLKRRESGTDVSRGAGGRRKRSCCVNCRHIPTDRRRTSYFCVECKVALHPACDAEYHSRLAEQDAINNRN